MPPTLDWPTSSARASTVIIVFLDGALQDYKQSPHRLDLPIAGLMAVCGGIASQLQMLVGQRCCAECRTVMSSLTSLRGWTLPDRSFATRRSRKGSARAANQQGTSTAVLRPAPQLFAHVPTAAVGKVRGT